MPQLADPNSLRRVLIGWSLSQRTNQDAGRDAGVKGSLVYDTLSAWCGHVELIRLVFKKNTVYNQSCTLPYSFMVHSIC